MTLFSSPEIRSPYLWSVLGKCPVLGIAPKPGEPGPDSPRRLLGGSRVVIIGVISRVTIVISLIRGLIPLYQTLNARSREPKSLNPPVLCISFNF